MKSAIRNPQSAILDGLPGAERIRQGLEDIRAGRRTMAACLVRMAQPRLSRANLMPPPPARDDAAELDLYQMLATEGANAHSRYNALVRELVSFEHALDHRLSPPLCPLPPGSLHLGDCRPTQTADERVGRG